MKLKLEFVNQQYDRLRRMPQKIERTQVELKTFKCFGNGWIKQRKNIIKIEDIIKQLNVQKNWQLGNKNKRRMEQPYLEDGRQQDGVYKYVIASQMEGGVQEDPRKYDMALNEW